MSPRPNSAERLRLVASDATEVAPVSTVVEHGTAREPGSLRNQGAHATLGDAELVALSCSGDTWAFERLYRRHAAFAINLAVRIQGSESDVEDIVHDAFLRAHQQLERLRDASLFRAWLGSIVVRLVRTRLRRRRLLQSLGLARPEPTELDAVATSDAGPEVRAQLAQVYSALERVPADDRIAWTLRYVEHQKLEMVAELSGCSLATAKRRILRAQEHLTTYLGLETKRELES